MNKQSITSWFAGLALVAASGTSGVALAQGFEKPLMADFIHNMVQQHAFDRDHLEQVLAQAELRQDILDAISRPAEAKPWYQYRPIFVNASRMEGGLQFWRENADTLARAATHFGVAPEVMVAIIGVETRYGQHTGRYRVLDALATLAFAYPPRSRFFTSELEHYLLMTREEQMDPLSLRGSYAGAMGKPQFISSSFRAYAVDFDGDGRRDLWDNTADAIGSVGNYFKQHGWRMGEPVVSRAKVKGTRYKEVLDRNLKPRYTRAQLAEYGVSVDDKVPEGLLGALFELETEQGTELWVGWHNFYVITRYNRSPLYAMAVYELSEQLRAARERERRS